MLRTIIDSQVFLVQNTQLLFLAAARGLHPSSCLHGLLVCADSSILISILDLLITLVASLQTLYEIVLKEDLLEMKFVT